MGLFYGLVDNECHKFYRIQEKFNVQRHHTCFLRWKAKKDRNRLCVLHAGRTLELAVLALLRADCAFAKEHEDEFVKQFIRVVRKFTDMQELTPEIVGTMINRIEVGQAQNVDGIKKQEIKIIYNFIGNIKE